MIIWPCTYEEVNKMAEQMASVAARLRMALDRSGKKQADLVRETGLDRGSISSYLSGKYEPKQKAIFLLARSLDVSEGWLMGYDTEMSRTDDQKKNDQLAQLVGRMRNDVEFFNAVAGLADLDEAQFQTVVQLLTVLKK
jgi:transcriptional regulator with XRE-family HTH domain